MLSSCEEDNKNFTAGTGTITPTITVDASIVSSRGEDLGQLGFDIPKPDDFSLRMTDESGSHTGEWKSISQFSPEMPYRVGTYLMTATFNEGAEGYDMPSFKGEASLAVDNGTNTPVDIKCSIANAIIDVNYSDGIGKLLKECTLTFHTVTGGEFIDYPRGETRPLFINPGDIAVMASVTRGDGRAVRVLLGRINGTRAAHHYTLDTSIQLNDAGSPVIIVDNREADVHFTLELSDRLFDGKAPEVTASGFSPGSPLTITEGETPAHDISMIVTGDNITSLRLSTLSPSLIAEGMPPEIDLMDLSDASRRLLSDFGLEWDGTKVTFNHLLSRIDYTPVSPASSFTLLAIDDLGRINLPATLTVITLDALVKIVDTSSSTIGVNTAAITLSSTAVDLDRNINVRTRDRAGIWPDAEIISITSTGENTHQVIFTVPEGNGDIDVTVYYCGRLKGSATIKRVPPVYEIEADAFAHTARFKVKCDDAGIIPVIVDYLTLFNGNSECTIFNRDRESGIVEIIGLEPDKSYTLRPSLTAAHDDSGRYCGPVTFTTEKTLGLPNGDFEEIENTLKYNNLQSGGKYSQTIIEIYDRCNYTSYDLSTPRGWATVNAKTFCTRARNRNTWYMQPSTFTVGGAVSGAYAVQLTNVAWDADGVEIPDYTQETTPYLRYNPNIPRIAHKAAGRLWLGSYSFNAATGEESIHEGTGFTSRPSALNGYYKYMPGKVTTNERAYAEVKVWGRVGDRDVIIAGGTANLSVTPAYTTFSIPLTYHTFGVKATRICVMLASSSDIGTIDYETAHITTTPDALTASSTGNVLCIDNLSLAY